MCDKVVYKMKSYSPGDIIPIYDKKVLKKVKWSITNTFIRKESLEAGVWEDRELRKVWIPIDSYYKSPISYNVARSKRNFIQAILFDEQGKESFAIVTRPATVNEKLYTKERSKVIYDRHPLLHNVVVHKLKQKEMVYG